MPFLSSFVRLAGGLGVSPCTLLDGITWEGEGNGAGFVLPDEGGGGRYGR